MSNVYNLHPPTEIYDQPMPCSNCGGLIVDGERGVETTLRDQTVCCRHYLKTDCDFHRELVRRMPERYVDIVVNRVSLEDAAKGDVSSPLKTGLIAVLMTGLILAAFLVG